MDYGAFTDLYLSVLDDLRQLAMVLLRISLIIYACKGGPPKVLMYIFVISVIMVKC